MTLLSAEKLSKAYDKQIIFDNLSFTLLQNDKIGLVGKNGSGKTTLFNIVTGSTLPDSGTINKSKECKIDYAEQEKLDFLDITLFDYVASARDDILKCRAEISKIEEWLSRKPNDEEALSKLGSFQEKYEHLDGFNFESEVKIILNGLGFINERFNDLIKNFSGGEKNRAALAKILAGNGNLLFLDEPTNHLDIKSTSWLEEYLNKSNKAYIIVSHDRTFLNNTVTKVWEIFNGRVDFYSGSFDKYLEDRSERKRLHEHKYKHQQERIKQLEDFVRRHMAGQKTKQAQSKLKYLSRIKRLPPPETDGRGPLINVESSGRSYAHIVACENLTVGYGDTEVASGINFDIYRGDKIGFIGDNGTGKSTILKTLIGELEPIDGEVKLGNNVDVVYFDQELADLNLSQTVLENIWEMDPSAESGTMRSFLGRFGFSGDDSLKIVSTLSGGEKTKLSLARLLYHPANFIIFDEPTNHLDIVSREALEEALNEYDGSCLIVSHDRYFLNKVANRIFHLNNERLTIYDGNYSYFEEISQPSYEYKPVKQSKSKDDYLSFKEKSKRIAKHKKEIKKTEELIAENEKLLEELTHKLNNDIPKTDWEQLEATTKEKNDTEDKIIELYGKLEELQNEEIE